MGIVKITNSLFGVKKVVSVRNSCKKLGVFGENILFEIKTSVQNS